MMEERLLAFRTKNKFLPTRVLVYRDGVSEVSFLRLIFEETPYLRMRTGPIFDCGRRGDARNQESL